MNDDIRASLERLCLLAGEDPTIARPEPPAVLFDRWMDKVERRIDDYEDTIAFVRQEVREATESVEEARRAIEAVKRMKGMSKRV